MISDHFSMSAAKMAMANDVNTINTIIVETVDPPFKSCTIWD